MGSGLVNSNADSIEEQGIDLAKLVSRLWVKRWWIVSSVILFTASFTAVAFLKTPTYRSSVTLVSVDGGESSLGGSLGAALGSLGGLASLAGVNFNSGGNNVEEALAVMRSRELTEAFLHDKRLLPVLYASKWDPARSDWKSGVKPPTSAQAYKFFDKNIRSIARDKKSGLITVHIDWKNREQAAEWANELVTRVNDEMRARAIENANASVGYLENELKATSLVGTREAINRLIEAQVKQRMVANVTREYAFRVVDKAMVSDADDPIKPKKLALIAAGPLVGFSFGVFGVLMLRLFAALSAGIKSRAA